jgi:hypothetical protein
LIQTASIGSLPIKPNLSEHLQDFLPAKLQKLGQVGDDPATADGSDQTADGSDQTADGSDQTADGSDQLDDFLRATWDPRNVPGHWTASNMAASNMDRLERCPGRTLPGSNAARVERCPGRCGGAIDLT